MAVSATMVSGRVVAIVMNSPVSLPSGVDQRVADVPEEGAHVLVVDLEVAEGALAAGAPVDQAVAAVDQALVVQVDEDRAHRQRRAGVHREALARPVGGDAEALVLREDARAVAVDELPRALQERLAADVAAVEPLGRQLALDQRVDGDRGVVDARAARASARPASAASASGCPRPCPSSRGRGAAHP